MKTDVVIVGAGPAGCAAAYDLTARGIRVALLDKVDFPRRKVCAGGLTIKTVRALRYPITPVIRHTVYELSVSCRMRRPKRLSGDRPICHMVDRSAFDQFCLKQTIAAGADFAVVKRIDTIDEDGHGVALQTDRGVIRGRFLIGADGAYSRVRRLTGRFPEFRMGFAAEGTLRTNTSRSQCMAFDFSCVPGGYGWVFPKKDRVNVGLYTQWPGVRISRRSVGAYAAGSLGPCRLTNVAGSALGIGGWRYRPGIGRILLVGDAAGLADPLLGEGLYHAVASGQQAADAVRNAMEEGDVDACRAYAHALVPLQRDLRFARMLAALFYRLPAAGHLLLTSPAATIPLMEGFALGLTLVDIFCNGYRFWLGLSIRGVAGHIPFDKHTDRD